MADRPALDASATPGVRSDLATASIDGELVIFDPVSSKVHQLDPVGSVIWELLDGEASLGELVVDLAAGFDVPEAKVRADVATLMQSLQEHDLLEGSAPTSPPTERSDEPDRPEYLKDPPAP